MNELKKAQQHYEQVIGRMSGQTQASEIERIIDALDEAHAQVIKAIRDRIAELASKRV
jgi:hypothetical protein